MTQRRLLASRSSSNGRRRRRPRRRRRRTSAKAWPPSAPSGRRASAGADKAEDLAGVRPAPLCLLRENELAVGEHVELRFTSLADRRLEGLVAQLGRETRGPFVVAASDRAGEDLDGHGEIVRARIVPTAMERAYTGRVVL